MKYYRLHDDINFPNRWYLGDILGDDDNWKFTIGEKIDGNYFDLEVNVYQNGDEMDYTITEGYSVPIVSQNIKEKLEHLEKISFIPVKISNKNINNIYYLMNLENLIDCVDEKNSIFEKFLVDDPIRPDLAGQYSAFLNLAIDAEKAKGNKIFRLKKHDIAIIVNEEVKQILENFKGVNLQELEK